ncbi:hypothetical protein A2U01_0025115 [Trifolium medium]|uniref:Uncharacterized protein n=1 Tax=Trifolium medium TaxID=97028 RepID=A0A392NW81_9FABA|nr:hypothetical protein [Trifolium medium]
MVKRICLDPTIIEEFCSQGPYFTPSKSIEFLKDLIVTPPNAPGKSGGKDDVGGAVKRNLSKVFDGV